MKNTVSPNVFWLSLIILLAVCGMFYVQKENEKSIRIAKERELATTIEVKKVVENKLTEAKKQISERDEQIKRIMDELEKENVALNDMEDQLEITTKEKEDLAAKIEELSAKLLKQVELEKIVVTPPAPASADTSTPAP